MSYYAPKSAVALERMPPSYASGNTIVYRAKRYLDKNMYFILKYFGEAGIIATEDDDLVRIATITVNDPYFTNLDRVIDYDDNTWGNAPATIVDPGAEVTELTFDLGQQYNFFILVRHWAGSGTNMYTRVYTSSNGITWYKVLDLYRTSVVFDSANVTNMRYVQIRVYNGSTQALNLDDNTWRLYTVEFYPVVLRTVLRGQDAVKLVTLFARNAYYQLLEVHEL